MTVIMLDRATLAALRAMFDALERLAAESRAGAGAAEGPPELAALPQLRAAFGVA